MRPRNARNSGPVSVVDNTANVTNPGLTSYVIENLANGTWYFVMTAVDGAGLESARTNPVSKTIG